VGDLSAACVANVIIHSMTDIPLPKETTQSEATIDPERQKKAKAYSRISRRLMLVSLAIGAVYVLAWLVFGWSVALRNALLAYTSNNWLLVAAFAVIFGGIYMVITLPLSYYEGFVLPHRFGLSVQSLRDWVLDQVKGGLVGGVLALVILEIIYAVLRAYPTTWWLWAAIILLVFNVILANLAPVVLMPIFNKFVELGEEYADLQQRLMRLFEEQGARVKGVYQFDMSRRTTQANAALTGLGNTRRIILGDTDVAVEAVGGSMGERYANCHGWPVRAESDADIALWWFGIAARLACLPVRFGPVTTFMAARAGRHPTPCSVGNNGEGRGAEELARSSRDRAAAGTPGAGLRPIRGGPSGNTCRIPRCACAA